MRSATRRREPAVAGQFYPGEPAELEKMVREFLQDASTRLEPRGQKPKALVVPHAGYVYSGPVAATAYASLIPFRKQIQRVVLLGPSHRVPLRGLAVSGVDEFSTPLGRIPVDREAEASILALPQVQTLPEAHALEHSLEVQLPFLQLTLDAFRLVPLSVGSARAEDVGQVLEQLWGGEETLLLISSDLSHYCDYDTARRLDARTSRAIEALRYEDIGDEDACGRMALRGLLRVARRKGMRAELLDLRNSGDTAGPRDQVVGYGAYRIDE